LRLKAMRKAGTKAKPRKAKARGTDSKRVRAILQKLDEAYPEATCALKHENPFQLLISTILSAQCTDELVNQVTQTLYGKYPSPETFAYANPRELQQDIRPTGFFRNKTKSIIGASKKIVEEFGGQVPRTMEEILTLPGVARKTANVVLGTAYGIPSGVVVDTHVQRLARRLDLSRNTDQEDRAGLEENYPARKMDSLGPSVDLARASRLPGAQATLRAVQSRAPVLLQGQDYLETF
jgi:endonuclease-3